MKNLFVFISLVIPLLTYTQVDPMTTAERSKFLIADFQEVINHNFIKLVDHKNLNTDVPCFKDTNPTVENIASFAWDKLADKFADADLHCVTVWENDRTYCSKTLT